MGVTPGFGIKHPAVAAFLIGQTPASNQLWEWPNGDQVVLTSYVGVTTPPLELIMSVRCMVTVGDQLLVCTNVHGDTHPWPGGRREEGESFAQTATREVHEETGWQLDPLTWRQLGFLHFASLREPTVSAWPSPDMFMLVSTGTAIARAAIDWTDTEGYEISSRLVPIDQAPATIEAGHPSLAYLPLLDRPFATGELGAR